MRPLLTIFFALVLIGCKSKDDSSIVDDKIAEKIEFQTKLHLGKKLSLTEVIGDSIDVSDGSLLLYTGYDCGSCVKVGFQIINAMDSILITNHVVIEIQSNKGADQLRYNYSDYIFTDNKDLIRKQLKYIKTPVLLLFDNNKKIKNIHFPESTEVVTTELIQDILQAKPIH